MSRQAESQPPPAIPGEQLLYARVLGAGMVLALVLLVATFIIYIAEVRPPHVPLRDLPRFWGLPAERFIHETSAPRGWAWLTELADGDYVSYLPLALVSGITGVCYLAILPGLLRRRDWAYAGIVCLEVLILIMAMTGILGARH